MTVEIKRRGLMLVLSSPSGAGKTTLARLLLESDPNVAMSVSATTRPKRPGEVDGRDYFFIDDEKFDNRSQQKPDPAVKADFERELARSDELVSKILAASPNDANALFSRVLANGLRGDYTAMIEKRNLASLSYMKTSRVTAQQLLAIDPNCYDAFLAVGVENYLLGTTPAPVRWVLRLTGSQTDKDEGIQRLRLTAEKGYYLAPFARLLLAVAALRDKDKKTARLLLAGLATEFPHNQLYSKELARIQ